MSGADAHAVPLAPAREDEDRMTLGLMLGVAGALVLFATGLGVNAWIGRAQQAKDVKRLPPQAYELIGIGIGIALMTALAVGLCLWVFRRARGDRRLGPARVTATGRPAPGAELRLRVERAARSPVRVRWVEVTLAARDRGRDLYLVAPLWSATRREEPERALAAGESLATEVAVAIDANAPAPSDTVRWTVGVTTALDGARVERRTFELA